MSIVDFQHLNQQIKKKLFEISYTIDCFNKTGDTDISRYAETYFKYLINIIYSKQKWKFEKANKVNQDTYDLYDTENKVCVQITSNNRQQKKDDLIKSFRKNHLDKNFNTLIVIFIANAKPRKPTDVNFEYFDYDIIEFASYIEAKCSQTELLKTRDILLANLELQRNSPQKQSLTRKTSIKTTEKEFLRCKKLEKELTKELLYPEFWKVVDREVLAKDPTNKFKDSRFILRSIEDESYPNIDENSNWSRTFMYDFYDKGILIWIDALFGTKAIINENKEWYIEKFEDRDTQLPANSRRINIRILGKLPFKNIVYLQDGDEYYTDYHLFCKYIGVNNSPYEEILYRYENSMGYYWDNMEISKKID